MQIIKCYSFAVACVRIKSTNHGKDYIGLNVAVIKEIVILTIRVIYGHREGSAEGERLFRLPHIDIACS